MISTAENQSPTISLRGKRVWVAGHKGMVGAALLRRLHGENCVILTADHAALDLTRQAETEIWMRAMRPEIIFIAAARVGGIVANARAPVEFLYENAMIALNIMKNAADIGLEKLLWLGSSCVYPKFAEQPIREDALLSGHLEETNEAYAIAKIVGIKLAEAYCRQKGKQFISAMPTNLYGPGDNFDLESSHVLPALMRKMHDAKVLNRDSVKLWGTGRPKREFLHVDDLADACIFLMKRYSSNRIINIGSGFEVSINELAALVARVVGYNGHIIFDSSKPDGTPRKLLDLSRLSALGWKPHIPFDAGLQDLYSRWLQSGDAAGAPLDLRANGVAINGGKLSIH